jgi:sulfatase modifying factor 1
MKLRVLILIVFLVALAKPSIPQQANAPLTKDQVMDLVKFGMNSRDLAKKIQERGIGFEPADDYLQALRNAGAQEDVIQALHAARPRPLTREQVGKLVAGGVPSQRAAELVKEHGIDFLADDPYLETLRLVGADDTLIAAVREASAAATGELVVATSPNAEVYLDGELRGRANSQGELALKAKLGGHLLRASLEGKKDFEQSVTLAARQATQVAARLADAGPPPGEVRVNPKDGLKYVWIPPGSFMMGCSPGDNECNPDERPSHQVNLTKGFWIGQTELPVGVYKRFARETGRALPLQPGLNGLVLNPAWSNEAMPMGGITWDEAAAYCSWAGGRLPSEAEWEYAARAGSSAARYGDLDPIAWFGDNSGRQHVDSAAFWRQTDFMDRFKDNGNSMHEVAQKRPNQFGLFDMLGNVWEWVNDWYDANYYQHGPSQDPQGPASGSERVQRGGGFISNPRNTRASDRDKDSPATKSSSYGVRCVQEADSR